MNRVPAEIINIETADAISLVDLVAFGDPFSCVLIETPETAPYLRIGNRVSLVFKETEIAIAKNFSGQISLRNRFAATIRAIENGVVLSKITMDFHGISIISIITARSAATLNLQPGDAVTGLVKANEIAIFADDGGAI